jgi:hypothetical protein
LAVAGFTFIPQTGSRSSAGAGFEGFVVIKGFESATNKHPPHASIGYALYWIQRQTARCLHSGAAKDYPMTYLDVVFRYGAAPGENELRAIDGMREVYGIRRVQFNEGERTVRVEFDASRLKSETVARLLRQAGVDVRERLTLA